jgi:hypothetical protein
MQVEVNGTFFQRTLGIRAVRPARVWKFIQTGKASKSTRLTARSDAVSADLMVERSALNALIEVSTLGLLKVRGSTHART